MEQVIHAATSEAKTDRDAAHKLIGVKRSDKVTFVRDKAGHAPVTAAAFVLDSDTAAAVDGVLGGTGPPMSVDRATERGAAYVLTFHGPSPGTTDVRCVVLRSACDLLGGAHRPFEIAFDGWVHATDMDHVPGVTLVPLNDG